MQRPANDGQEQVVDRRIADFLADFLELDHGNAHGLEYAVRGHRTGEPRRRRQARQGRREVARRQRGELPAQPRWIAGHALHKPGTQARQPTRGVERELRELGKLPQVAGEGARIDLDRRRLAVRNAHRHAGALLGLDVVRRQRVQGACQFARRLAVDQRVMKLGVEREAACRHARHVVEPLDDVRFPERLAAIQRTRMQARNLDAELAPVTRLRQRDVPHVELDVEVAILDPPRAVEHPGHGHEPAAEMREALDARREEAQHVLEPHLAARRRRRVVDTEAGDVHVVVAALELQERVIEAGQLSHVLILRGAIKCRTAARR